jgi:hypothetical protein
MYTIWFRAHGMQHVDIEGVYEACQVWDVLAKSFSMLSQRPSRDIPSEHEHPCDAIDELLTNDE